MKKIYFLLIFIAISCVSESSPERPRAWVGEWTAEWKTPPESPSYRGIEDMEFYMDGKFIFTTDSLTVQNYGYPGCIFAIDTLKHTQSWKVSNDTLFSINDPKTPGITYKITSLSENKIELQLMEDIFVTLTK
ncbi:MAG: hypothetical protein AAGC64_09005 [Bacteroidota bacterium]